MLAIFSKATHVWPRPLPADEESPKESRDSIFWSCLSRLFALMAVSKVIFGSVPLTLCFANLISLVHSTLSADEHVCPPFSPYCTGVQVLAGEYLYPPGHPGNKTDLPYIAVFLPRERQSNKAASKDPWQSWSQVFWAQTRINLLCTNEEKSTLVVSKGM